MILYNLLVLLKHCKINENTNLQRLNFQKNKSYKITTMIRYCLKAQYNILWFKVSKNIKTKTYVFN